MTADMNTAELDLPASPEPGLTADQVIARAEAMIPELIERQAEAEERGFYAEDVHERFVRNGFYRILVPRRYGGYEFGVETFLRVSMTLLRGCSSTGWMYSLGAAHALMPAEDGQPPATLLFVAPRSRWVRLDDWGQQLGLRGSGSHSIMMENGHIPGHLALPGVQIAEYDATSGTPGRTLHGNPEYGGALLAFINFLNCSMAVGMARGALDAYEDLLRVRTTLIPPVVPRYQDPDYQLWYGDAVGIIGTAEAALLNAAQQWHHAAAQGPAAVTRELDLRLSAICRHVARLCWEGMAGYIMPTAGSSAIRHGERLERVWRDMSTMRTHAGLSILLPTIAMRELAKSLVH